MKTLIDTGNGIATLSESDGPPLEHEEWVEEQTKEHERQRKELESKQKARPQARSAAPGDGDEEETFHGRPLSDFDNVADEELANEEGIGEATAAKIIKARKKRDRRANR